MTRSSDGLGNPSLESQLASELREVLRATPLGGQFTLAPSAEICSSLEFFLPKVLRIRYPEWEKESLDGIFIASASRIGRVALQLGGTCILISDQTVTPFLVELEMSEANLSIVAFRLFLGEAGGGPLGISGPECNSQDAKRLLETFPSRLGSIKWRYSVASDDIGWTEDVSR